MPDRSIPPVGGNFPPQGFTLIELLIAVAIIGIIVSIAYPSYNRYVERSLRTDAHAGLLQAASEMERCYSRQYSYNDCTVTATSPDGSYAITVANGGDEDGGFLLTASSERDDGCEQVLQYNALGERLPAACW